MVGAKFTCCVYVSKHKSRFSIFLLKSIPSGGVEGSWSRVVKYLPYVTKLEILDEGLKESLLPLHTYLLNGS